MFLKLQEKIKNEKGNILTLLHNEKLFEEPKTDKYNCKKEVIKKQNNIHYYLLKNLGVEIKLENFTHKEIEKTERKHLSLYEYSNSYLKFLNCIELANSSKKSIRKFDLCVFACIFNEDHYDAEIHNFIKKLIEDPCFYENDDKCKLFEIYKYVFFYCKKLNKNVYIKLLKEKLMNMKIYDKNIKSNFNYLISDDPYFDILVMQTDIKICLFEEALFCNSFYKKYLINKKQDKYIELFAERLLNVLQKTDKIYHISFMRNVFVQGSVLASLIDDFEVCNLIFKLFKNIKNYKEKHFIIIYKFANIFYVHHSFEFIESINKSVKDFDIAKNNQKKSILLNKIYASNCFSEIFQILCQNKESFLIISEILNEIFQTFNLLTDMNLKFSNIIEMIEFMQQIQKILKEQFLIGLIDKFVHIYILLLKKLNLFLNSKNEKEKFICDFFLKINDFFNNFSNLINYLRKIENKIGDNKKKKKENFKICKSKLAKNTEDLIFNLRKIETWFQKNSDYKEFDIPCLKFYSFKEKLNQ